MSSYLCFIILPPYYNMKSYHLLCFSLFLFRAVTDPRNGNRVALKKMPNVFQNIVSSKRVYRELRMLCFFKHDNVSCHAFCNSTSYSVNSSKEFLFHIKLFPRSLQEQGTVLF